MLKVLVISLQSALSWRIDRMEMEFHIKFAYLIYRISLAVTKLVISLQSTLSWRIDWMEMEFHLKFAAMALMMSTASIAILASFLYNSAKK